MIDTVSSSLAWEEGMISYASFISLLVKLNQSLVKFLNNIVQPKVCLVVVSLITEVQ